MRMSEPRKNYEDPIHGAVSEIVSAESALNMEPRPKENMTEKEKERGWLLDKDHWVDHAMEHLHATFKLLVDQKCERDVYREVLHRYVVLTPEEFRAWLEERCDY
jgi:hypothetical protein